MNIIEQQELLKDLSDQAIAGEMQQPSGNVPLYLVAGEAKRRADLRQRFKAEQSGPPPTSTVHEDLLNSIMASEMPAAGIAQGIQPPPQQMAPPPPQQMAQVGGPTAPPTPNPNMPVISPTGEAPMDQIPQAQGIMAGQQGNMVQRLAGGGLVREDRKYANPRGYVGKTGEDAYSQYWGYTPPPRQSLLTKRPGDPKVLSPIEAQRRRDAQIQAQGLEDEALGWQYKDTSDFSMVDPTYDPILTSIDPVDQSVTTRRYSDRRINQTPPIDTGPLTSSFLANQPIGLGDAAFSADRPLTADEIARGTDFRGLRDTNKEIKANRDALGKLKIGKNPIEFDPGGASALTVDQINPEDYKGVDPIKIGARGTVANPTQTGFNKLKLAEIRKKQLDDLRNANADPYKNMVARLDERRAALAEDKGGNVAQALMRLGSGMMAGKSQHGLVNVGEAGQDTLKYIQDRKTGQEGREDALLASEMGVISGQRSFDKDIRDQANTIVQDRIKENEMINKETARANTENVDNYNRDVGKKDQAFLDKRFLAVQKKNDQKYNTTQKINLQQARIAEQVRAKRADQATIDRMANSTNAERRDQARELQQNLDREIRILQLKGQSLSETKNDIIRRQEIRGTEAFRRETLGKTQDFTAKESALDRKAKKDAPPALLKSIQIAQAMDESPEKKQILGVLTGANKREQASLLKAQGGFDKAYAKWVEGNVGSPPKDAKDWAAIRGTMPLGTSATFNTFKAIKMAEMGMGGSGGGVNKLTKKGKVLKYTK